MVVGITGGIGSGKSTVVAFFKEFTNTVVYIADVEAKKIMNTSSIIQSKIIEEFGLDSYKNGQLNRQYIADIVFNDKNKLLALNSIVHPEVAAHFSDFTKNNKEASYILYENAILFENNSDVLCDCVITVTAPLSVRVERVLQRDTTTKEAVLARINNQWSDDKKILQSNYIIENVSLKNTKNKVKEVHKKLLLRY